MSGLAFAERAEVFIDADGCGLLTETGFMAGDLHQVTANSSNGNIKLTCSQDLDPTSTGRSIIYSFDNTGVICFAGLASTEDWHQVISRSGKAKLTCHFKD